MARRAVVIGLVALSVVLARLPGHSADASTSISLPPLGQPRPGDLDRTFGGDGTVVTDFGGFDSIEDLAVQRDGKIVAVGATYGPTTGNQVDVARYAKNGALDPTFGIDGKVTTDFGGAANAVALQTDGKIVAAGVAASGGATGFDIGLVRYDTNGTLDPTFGLGGKVVTDFGSSHDTAGAIAIQPDGKLVVAGSTRPFGAYDSHPPDFALARSNANGTLDTSFGAGGKVSTGYQPGWADIGYGVALAPRG